MNISPIHNKTSRDVPHSDLSIKGTTNEIIFIHRVELNTGYCHIQLSKIHFQQHISNKIYQKEKTRLQDRKCYHNHYVQRISSMSWFPSPIISLSCPLKMKEVAAMKNKIYVNRKSKKSRKFQHFIESQPKF